MAVTPEVQRGAKPKATASARQRDVVRRVFMILVRGWNLTEFVQACRNYSPRVTVIDLLLTTISLLIYPVGQILNQQE